MYYSVSQGSFCVVLQRKSSSPAVSTYLHIKHRHFIPSMTKMEHQWLLSLHHGYQTDSSFGKLNTKYLGGDEGKIRWDVSCIFFQTPTHTRHLSPNETPTKLSGTRPAVPFYLPRGRRALSQRCSSGVRVEEEMDRPIGGDLIYSYGSMLRPSGVYMSAQHPRLNLRNCPLGEPAI